MPKYKITDFEYGVTLNENDLPETYITCEEGDVLPEPVWDEAAELWVRRAKFSVNGIEGYIHIRNKKTGKAEKSEYVISTRLPTPTGFSASVENGMMTLTLPNVVNANIELQRVMLKPLGEPDSAYQLLGEFGKTEINPAAIQVAIYDGYELGLIHTVSEVGRNNNYTDSLPAYITATIVTVPELTIKSIAVIGITSPGEGTSPAYRVREYMSDGSYDSAGVVEGYTFSIIGTTTATINATTGILTIPNNSVAGDSHSIKVKAVSNIVEGREATKTVNIVDKTVVTVTKVSTNIVGPASANEDSTPAYKVIETYSDNSTVDVTAQWSLTAPEGSFSGGTWNIPANATPNDTRNVIIIASKSGETNLTLPVEIVDTTVVAGIPVVTVGQTSAYDEPNNDMSAVWKLLFSTNEFVGGTINVKRSNTTTGAIENYSIPVDAGVVEWTLPYTYDLDGMDGLSLLSFEVLDGTGYTIGSPAVTTIDVSEYTTDPVIVETGDIHFYEDFEVSGRAKTLDEVWEGLNTQYEQNLDKESFKVVNMATEGIAVSGFAGRFRLHTDFGLESNGTRSEVLFPREFTDTSGEGNWYAFGFYCKAAEYLIDYKHDILNQWHQGTSPSLSLRAENDRFYMYIGGTKETRKEYDMVQMVKDGWNIFVMNIIHSNGSNGLVKVWHNDVLVLNHSGPNMYSLSSFDAPRWKVGIYKDDWNNAETTGSSERIFFLAEVKMGNGDCNYEQMRPRIE